MPTFLTRNVQGILRVRDGETSLIGGLILGRNAETVSGLLGLPSVPLIGKIFSRTEERKEDQEILISLTPHLVRAPKITEEDLTTLYVGTQESVRVPSARPPLFGRRSPRPAARAPAAGRHAGDARRRLRAARPPLPRRRPAGCSVHDAAGARATAGTDAAAGHAVPPATSTAP